MQFNNNPSFTEVVVLDVIAGFFLMIDLDKTLIIGEVFMVFTASIYTLIKIIDWILKQINKYKHKTSEKDDTPG